MCNIVANSVVRAPPFKARRMGFWTITGKRKETISVYLVIGGSIRPRDLLGLCQVSFGRQSRLAFSWKHLFHHTEACMKHRDLGLGLALKTNKFHISFVRVSRLPCTCQILWVFGSLVLLEQFLKISTSSCDVQNIFL